MKGDLAKLKERYSFYWKRQWKLWQFWACEALFCAACFPCEWPALMVFALIALVYPIACMKKELDES